MIHLCVIARAVIAGECTDKLNFNGGIENMDKTTLQFFTAIKNGEVKHIGKSIIIQPEVKFGGGTIKWFDDKHLVKNKGEETC